MEDSTEAENEEPKDFADIETEKYMEQYEREIWDEAIRTYNEMLFGLFRYS
jgi:hypothetical protein